jgi:serine/alanine adding enzyme
VRTFAIIGIPNGFLFCKIYLMQDRGIKLFGAIFNNQVIGTMIQLCYKNRIYDWYAGSYRKYSGKCPNDILPWKVFLLAKKEGYSIFDFGGAGKPNVSYGVRKYKKQFGGEFVNFGRYTNVHKTFLMKVGKVGFYFYRLIKN